jgi:hypothetical protein
MATVMMSTTEKIQFSPAAICFQGHKVDHVKISFWDISAVTALLS